MILNSQQELIVNAAINWYRNSSEQTFEFTGHAGTGKSVVLNEIIYRLGLQQNEVLPMAYTGQAAIVMRTKGLSNAVTCHSGLFDPIEVPLRDKDGHIVRSEQFDKPIMIWDFIPKSFFNSSIKLIVLDEAWMIPRSFRRFIDDTGIKVLATGDPGQLPPIIEDPGYLIDTNIYRLTQLMRQSENSPIIYISNRLREGLPIECGLYGNDVLVIFDDELDNNVITNAQIVLCGKNVTRDRINSQVRISRYGMEPPFPLYLERMICRKNNWSKSIDDISLVNGLTGFISRPPSVDTYNKKRKTFDIDFQPDLLSRPFRDLSLNHQYLMANYDQKEKIKRNRYTRGELFEYAYASTVHLAQGSEYSSGIYIEEFMGTKIQAALNYTAVTRFKNKLIYARPKLKFWYMDF